MTGGNRAKNAIKRIAMILVISGALAVGAWGEGAKQYSMAGEISAIDLVHDTVVVEVPVGGDRQMTVGGPLVPEAKLKRNGRKASLTPIFAHR